MSSNPGLAREVEAVLFVLSPLSEHTTDKGDNRSTDVPPRQGEASYRARVSRVSRVVVGRSVECLSSARDLPGPVGVMIQRPLRYR